MIDRRRFVAAAGAAPLLASCRTTVAPPPIAEGQRVSLAQVRRLIVERHDALLGRCRYVAELGARRIARPILAARRGDLVDVEIVNRLPQPTTVHFHGLVVPEAQDGAGFTVIEPGASKAVRFRIHNRAGLYWLHSHAQGLTAEQVHAGLAALVVVSDDEDAALDKELALGAGSRLALAVSDARVADGRLLPYAPTAEDCVTGWLGNRALVNGALEAAFDVAAGWVRVQMLNACNARGLLLAFRDGDAPIPFHLLGTDGGLLEASLELERVFVHPAERVDIALDLAAHRRVAAVSLGFDPRMHAQSAVPNIRHPIRARYPPLAAAEVCRAATADTAARLPDGAPLPLFMLRARAPTAGGRPSLPTRLSSLPEPDANARVRRVRLDFDDDRGFLIDRTPYRIDEVAFRVERGAREVWEIRNSPISMPHPMHLHGPAFRVLRRQGTFGPARALATQSNGRLPTDLGLKDTVVVWPNETVWIATDFSLPREAAFAGAQRYLFHCHNLEHEDGMMMRNFAIV